MLTTAPLTKGLLTTALLAAGLLALAGCSDPRLNAGLSLGADGVRVHPSLSADIGGLGVAVTP